MKNVNGITNSQMPLNTKVETILTDMKKKLQAEDIIVVVMDSKSGKILSMTSINDGFKPNSVQQSNNAINYTHEHGSVIKPIVFSMLLDKGLVHPNETIDCHDGNYTLGVKTILDEQKFKSLSAEEVIVHSSTIGMVQLAQRMNGKEFVDGLNKFGFSHFSGIDLPNERSGSIPTSEQLDNYLYKAIVSYGYGVSSNPLQMVKAYNVFNNNGRMLIPKINQTNKIESTQVISPDTAKQMKRILIKTVNEGTGKAAQTAGLEIGGKTGSVYIAKNGQFTHDSYNTSFVGFANDDKQAYTIGITVIEPKSSYYPSTTVVPVFKAIVDMMVGEKYLEPKNEKGQK